MPPNNTSTTVEGAYAPSRLGCPNRADSAGVFGYAIRIVGVSGYACRIAVENTLGVMNTPCVSFSAKLERKHPKLPVYVVVPAPKAQALELRATAVVEGTVNGHLIGRRSIKRWDSSEHSPWFVEFTAPFCTQAGITVGEEIDVALWLASPALPAELESWLHHSPSLRAAWNELSDYTRRTSAEHVHAGKSPATRSRRAAAVIATLRQVGQPRSHDA